MLTATNYSEPPATGRRKTGPNTPVAIGGICCWGEKPPFGSARWVGDHSTQTD